MVSLSDIQQSIAPDLKALNDIIASTLQSPSHLMNEIVTRYLKVKGKQLRPLLVLLSGRYFGGITDKVLNAGAAIEMLHNASLIHDDVIDNASERRGEPTISSVWDNHVAVLVGDFFVSGALACANRTADMRILGALSVLGSDLALGEIDQFENSRSRDIDEKEYFSIIGNKTASLFKSCVEVGALAAGADENQLDGLRRYAELLGMCFQIKDDTFDYYHDPAVGKPTGNDLREGKITLPLIYALTRTDLPEHDAMLELSHKAELTQTDIEQLVDYAKQAGGIDYAYQTMNRLRTEACDILDKNYGQSDEIDAFKQIFDYIIERNL